MFAWVWVFRMHNMQGIDAFFRAHFGCLLALACYGYCAAAVFPLRRVVSALLQVSERKANGEDLVLTLRSCPKTQLYRIYGVGPVTSVEIICEFGPTEPNEDSDGETYVCLLCGAIGQSCRLELWFVLFGGDEAGRYCLYAPVNSGRLLQFLSARLYVYGLPVLKLTVPLFVFPPLILCRYTSEQRDPLLQFRNWLERAKFAPDSMDEETDYSTPFRYRSGWEQGINPPPPPPPRHAPARTLSLSFCVHGDDI